MNTAPNPDSFACEFDYLRAVRTALFSRAAENKKRPDPKAEALKAAAKRLEKSRRQARA